jgi:hypothetical protein
MGSLQKAVKAFLSVSDDTMLDQWIPDEDWVHQIRENGKNDCSIKNLNSVLAKECTWQNNHTNLHRLTIFYNKKNIRISKTKVTAAKQFRFYHVLSAIKPAPTVPSDQGVYQSLGADLDRSNRSLKQTAPSQADKVTARRTQPPT